MRLTYTAAEPQLTAGLDDRVLTGLALPYGQPGNTSAGRVTVDAGAVTIPADLRRVKLFTEHGRTIPVGYATAAADSPDRLDMSFHVAATPTGDTALLEASEGVRDALSVELDNIVIRSGHVTAGDLVAVALTSIPAYPDARLITAADTPTEETPVPDISGSFTGQLDGQLTETASTEPATETASTEPATDQVRASAPRAMTAARPQASLSAVAARVNEAVQMRDPRALEAALVDIKWSDGAGAAGAPPQLLGELWEGVGYTRKFVTASNYGTDLRSLSVGGFVWDPSPGVDEYAGDKAAVPSFPAKWVFKSFPAQRLAGANDVDRAYEDLEVPGFWEGYWRAMAESYAVKSDDYVLAKLTAAATAGPAVTSAWGAVVDGLVKVATYGGTPKVAVAANLIGGIAETPATAVPFLLQSMFGNLNDLIGVAGAGLADDTVLVYSQSAVTVKEAGSVPIRVQAVNIPNGGIDAALFGYIVGFVTQPAAVLKYTVAPAAPAAE